MKTSVSIAVASLVNLGCILGFGIWIILRPTFPDTLWQGTGCIQLKTVSVDKVLLEQNTIKTAYTNTLASTSIDLDTIEFVNLDDGVQVYVSGFLKAKTPTAARVMYSDSMNNLENDTVEFKSFGIFEINDCGLTIKLPINSQTSTIVPVSPSAINDTVVTTEL